MPEKIKYEKIQYIVYYNYKYRFYQCFCRRFLAFLSFAAAVFPPLLLCNNLRQHRTIHAQALEHNLACIFSVIFHKNALQHEVLINTTKYRLRFLFHLTKNLTAQYRTQNYAVLP